VASATVRQSNALSGTFVTIAQDWIGPSLPTAMSGSITRSSLCRRYSTNEIELRSRSPESNRPVSRSGVSWTRSMSNRAVLRAKPQYRGVHARNALRPTRGRLVGSRIWLEDVMQIILSPAPNARRPSSCTPAASAPHVLDRCVAEGRSAARASSAAGRATPAVSAITTVDFFVRGGGHKNAGRRRSSLRRTHRVERRHPSDAHVTATTNRGSSAALREGTTCPGGRRHDEPAVRTVPGLLHPTLTVCGNRPEQLGSHGSWACPAGRRRSPAVTPRNACLGTQGPGGLDEQFCDGLG
jgi:hypothetical protein